LIIRAEIAIKYILLLAAVLFVLVVVFLIMLSKFFY
jgi:hypothetical protein